MQMRCSQQSDHLSDLWTLPTGVMIGSWVCAAALLGDYKGGPPTHDNW